MKARKRRKIKLTTKIIIIIILIFILTYILINNYTKKANPLIIKVMEQNLTKYTNSFLSKNISYDVLNNKNLDNILIINKNKDGEILYVDYNLDKAYEALEVITDVIYDDLINLENNYFPFFIYSKSPLLSSFGPKLYVKVDFINSILTNIKSKITNYGLNNALVELFVTIDLRELITTPVSKKELTISYDVLVASKVINGRVPLIYGDTIKEESSSLNIPLT